MGFRGPSGWSREGEEVYDMRGYRIESLKAEGMKSKDGEGFRKDNVCQYHYDYRIARLTRALRNAPGKHFRIRQLVFS